MGDQQEKKSTTLTPEVLMSIAEKNGLMLGRDQAQTIIDDNREWFRGKTIKGSDVVDLIRQELKLSTRFDAAVQRLRQAEDIA